MELKIHTLKVTAAYKAIFVLVLTLLLTEFVYSSDDVDPTLLKFRRQAVRRMILDETQSISLSSLDPSNIAGLDVMHPHKLLGGKPSKYIIEDGLLKITAVKSSKSALWVGGFNPYALYQLDINNVNGSASVGIDLSKHDRAKRLNVMADFENGKCYQLRWQVYADGNNVLDEVLKCKDFEPVAAPFRLQVQMLGVGMNVYIRKAGPSRIINERDFVKYFDLRQKSLMRQFDFSILTDLKDSGEVAIKKAAAVLSPGIGQADTRIVTYEDGSPLFRDKRIYILTTIRGCGLPHPSRGIFSMNPSVFDLKFEGIILYDRGDGLLRNDLASNLFYDRKAKEWRGFITGFSSYGDPDGRGKKEIWAVHSSCDPLFGLSIMEAYSVGLIGDYEDSHCIYDEEAGKWRMLLCENYGQGYRAVIRESSQWDGPYEKIAGPVTVDSTGTEIQKFGQKRYAIFGSSDRKIYIYSYPDLKAVGTLDIYLPPWSEKSGTRIWPNIVPLPQGYPAKYMAVMMDRVNFPGIQKQNWTYGALYLYYAE